MPHPSPQPVAEVSRFGAGSSRQRSVAALASVALAVLLFSSLMFMGVLPERQTARRLVAVTVNLDEPRPQAPVRQARVEPVRLDAPAPQVARPDPPVATALVPVAEAPPAPSAPEPAPPAPEPVAMPAPVAPAGPVDGGDMSARRLVTIMPAYPVDSRRKREQGTVLLALVLGLDGRVAEIMVHKSSGFARLDEAALSAVRKWRWVPTLRDGQPVMVRGTLAIPFVLH